MNLENIIKPTLLVDLVRVRRNIQHMVDKAKNNNVEFRPHFKTHQSAPIGKIFKEFNIKKITVTSVEMASYFANHGWSDITIAMPVNIREINKINELATKIKLNLIVDSEFSIKFLQKHLLNSVDVWIEINAGYNRSGVQFDNIDEISKIITLTEKSDKTIFTGILSHFGNSYAAKNTCEVKTIYSKSLEKLIELQKLIENKVGIKFRLSVGDTPSCSIIENFGQVDEIRPGNFVFYDLMQFKIGSCKESDIAVVLACPVISKNFKRNEIVLYGGAIHLSKEYILDNNCKNFGAIVAISKNGWENLIEYANIKSLSQEHAVVHAPDSLLRSVEIGDLMGVIPVHSCLTANLMGRYLTTDGETIEMARYR